MVKMREIKLIATLGPSSLNKNVLSKLKNEVDIFRLNMSHLNLTQLKKNLQFLKKNSIKNICIDTEGAQIRTIFYPKKKFLKKNEIYKLTNDKINLKNTIQLYPEFNFAKIKLNSRVKIGFNGLELKVIKLHQNQLICKVNQPGYLEANKGVHFDDNIFLQPLTNKDKLAIKIAKKFNVKIFALSFANNFKDVKYLKSLITKKDIIISKVETKKGFLNRKSITSLSDAILVDRGDLSRYIEISKIPLAQRLIINDAMKLKKKVYVATNLLETMINSNEPTRAESNDIFSSLESGCSGLVLAAETAIGKYPISCVEFLKKCILVFTKKDSISRKEKNFF